MFKMPHACYNHCKIILFTIFNGIFIPYRTAGLYKCSDTCCMSNFYTIIKRKKCIACQYSTFQIKIKLLCFFNGLPQCINPLMFDRSLYQ